MEKPPHADCECRPLKKVYFLRASWSTYMHQQQNASFHPASTEVTSLPVLETADHSQATEGGARGLLAGRGRKKSQNQRGRLTMGYAEGSGPYRLYGGRFRNTPISLAQIRNI